MYCKQDNAGCYRSGYVVVLIWFLVEIFSNQFISFKPVCFFQTSSIIEVACKDGAVLRTIASHQCGLEVPLNG